MAKVVSIHSFRGGTGKSNSTANLATLIAKAGHRVGIVDTDIQSPGIHVLFQFDQSSAQYALNDYLWGNCEIEQAAYDVTQSAIGNVEDDQRVPRIFLIPSSIQPGEIGRVLKEGFDVGLLNDGFKRLVSSLELDYLLVDTHPGVNEETLLSIVISDILLLILRPDSQDFQGTAVTLELARQLTNQNIFMLINKVPPGMDTDQLKLRVESSYNVDVAGMLPLNHEIVRLASNGIFVNRYPNHPFTLELKAVADKLIANQVKS